MFGRKEISMADTEELMTEAPVDAPDEMPTVASDESSDPQIQTQDPDTKIVVQPPIGEPVIWGSITEANELPTQKETQPMSDEPNSVIQPEVTPDSAGELPAVQDTPPTAPPVDITSPSAFSPGHNANFDTGIQIDNEKGELAICVPFQQGHVSIVSTGKKTIITVPAR
jgi:hypothetical protein